MAGETKSSLYAMLKERYAGYGTGRGVKRGKRIVGRLRRKTQSPTLASTRRPH